MKTSRTISLVAIALCIGFLAARWSQAQPAAKTPTRQSSTNDDIAFHELESLFSYLEDTKQTNVIQQINDVFHSSLLSQKSVDLKLTVTILQYLRDGRTNEVFEFLEGHMNSDITFFGVTYSALPLRLREQPALKVLRAARDYRAKFPFKDPNQKVDEQVAKVFKILDEKTSQ
jgi:hypothetical protein